MFKHLKKQKNIARLFQLLLALIPTLEGFLAVFNDVVGAKTTLQTVIIPLLEMQGVQSEFAHSWRAIHSTELAEWVYFGLVAIEGLVGVIAIIGLVKMIKTFSQEKAAFIQAQAWARAACLIGILAWGLAFFVIGGDYFLSWQTTNLSYLQGGGLNYTLIMFIPYILMKNYERSGTI